MRKSANTTYEKTTTWTKDLNIGDKLEGFYESKEEFEGDFGQTTKYVIASPDGVKYGVFGLSSIKRQFAKIPVGSYVWIEYTGETTSAKGRNFKSFNIDYDDEYQQ